MNKNIKLAVAGAVLALSASAANAGVIIPAGEWTVDISGNVNSYAIWKKGSGTAMTNTGLIGNSRGATNAVQSTGLLPNFLSVAGSSRQNDLDVTWLISINPGGWTSHGASNGSGTEHRQAYMTFGDKSWGSVKIGKDLGIYASDAILNDMTLLGVGAPTTTGTTTLGRIGTGFQYADWKQQIAYTTPNFNGFQATVGITQAWGTLDSGVTGAVATTGAAISHISGKQGGAAPAFEGKASYSFAANDVNGKIWVSGLTQKVDGVLAEDNQMWSADIGANIKVAGFDLTGYYYGGEGTGTTIIGMDGYSAANTAGGGLKKRDVDGGYVQVKYTLPFKTVAGLSWGQSNLDRAANEAADADLVKSNEMWTAALYHPLTKSINLVAEYSHVTTEGQTGLENTTNVGSLGGILFF